MSIPVGIKTHRSFNTPREAFLSSPRVCDGWDNFFSGLAINVSGMMEETQLSSHLSPTVE
jgi:hypothetical protein